MLALKLPGGNAFWNSYICIQFCVEYYLFHKDLKFNIGKTETLSLQNLPVTHVILVSNWVASSINFTDQLLLITEHSAQSSHPLGRLPRPLNLSHAPVSSQFGGGSISTLFHSSIQLQWYSAEYEIGSSLANIHATTGLKWQSNSIPSIFHVTHMKNSHSSIHWIVRAMISFVASYMLDFVRQWYKEKV